jgi:hypothetical protein
MDELRQGGLILSSPNPKSWVLGGVGSVEDEINLLGDWTKYLPKPEEQQSWRAADGSFVDTYSCVTHSFLNSIEIRLKRMELPIDFDDRYLAVRSGTIPRIGNSLESVCETARTYGVPKEHEVPSSMGQGTEAEWFALDAQGYDDVAAKFIDEYDFAHNWVDTEDIKAVNRALRTAPLQITVKLGLFDRNTGFWSRSEGVENHAVTLIKINEDKSKVILDHYRNWGVITRTLSPDFKLGKWAKLNIIKTKKPMPTTEDALKSLKNDSLIVVTDTGERLAYMGGKLYRDEAGKLLLELTARNAKDDLTDSDNTLYFDRYAVYHFIARDLEGIPRFNLKGEKLI